MDIKQEFIHRIIHEKETISSLCREFRISRPTAYKWISRYKNEGISGLFDRSKIPVSMPTKTDHKTQNLILNCRERFPDWGGRKLRQVLINEGHKDLPSESTFNRILLNSGKINPQESQKRKAFIRFERSAPNELWQMDFKGHFSIIEGRCHPLTILDDCSRYSICLKACQKEDESSVRQGLENAFREYGLPEAMTMDNGSPWMGFAPYRLSRLTVWLMRLGIKVSHSRPYHPQTQGKDERFHRSLKEEFLKYHTFRDLAEAQRAFDEWRTVYNHIRPHQALKMLCPAQKYQSSPRQFPEKMPSIEYEIGDEVKKVKRSGEIYFKGKHCYVGACLSGESVAFRHRSERKWDIYYCKNWIGSFELKV